MRSQRDIAAKEFARKQILPTKQITTRSNVLEEQLKFVNKVVDVVTGITGGFYFTATPREQARENLHAQVRLVPGRKKEEKVQQNYYINFQIDEL